MHVLVARLRLNLFNDDGDGSVHIFFYSIRYFTSLFKFYTVPWFIPEDCLHITLGPSIRFSNSYVCFFAVCPDGSRPVNCFANPCDVSNGCYNIPMASCRYDIISFFTSVLKRYENKQLNCKVSHLALIMLSIWFQSNSFHDLKANASLIIFLFKNKISSFVALTFTR